MTGVFRRRTPYTFFQRRRVWPTAGGAVALPQFRRRVLQPRLEAVTPHVYYQRRLVVGGVVAPVVTVAPPILRRPVQHREAMEPRIVFYNRSRVTTTVTPPASIVAPPAYRRPPLPATRAKVRPEHLFFQRHYPYYLTRTPSLTDTAPDQFTFTDVTSQELGALITSNTITISGINSTAPVNFLETGHLSGQFSINGAAFADLVTTTIENGDTLQLRLTSAVLQNEIHSINVVIGGVEDTWDVTTLEDWTDQGDTSTIWSDQSNESTTWTDQPNESTTWTDDP